MRKPDKHEIQRFRLHRRFRVAVLAALKALSHGVARTTRILIETPDQSFRVLVWVSALEEYFMVYAHNMKYQVVGAAPSYWTQQPTEESALTAICTYLLEEALSLALQQEPDSFIVETYGDYSQSLLND